MVVLDKEVHLLDIFIGLSEMKVAYGEVSSRRDLSLLVL